MNVKQLKALRKSQHEVMRPLRGQLDDDTWQRLNDYVTSVVQLLKVGDEERLLLEVESLKRQLAEQEDRHREDLIRTRQTCADELAAKVSRLETRYQKKTAQLETSIAKVERLEELAGKGLLQVNTIACTTNAMTAAKNRFGNAAMGQLMFMAVDVIGLRIEEGQDKQWRLGEFDALPYLTDHGWNVFLCVNGELATLLKTQKPKEFIAEYVENQE